MVLQYRFCLGYVQDSCDQLPCCRISLLSRRKRLTSQLKKDSLRNQVLGIGATTIKTKKATGFRLWTEIKPGAECPVETSLRCTQTLMVRLRPYWSHVEAEGVSTRLLSNPRILWARVRMLLSIYRNLEVKK